MNNYFKFIQKLTSTFLILLLIITGTAACGSKDEVYRNVKVLDIKGTSYLDREGTQMPVYKELVLQGNDQITTEKESQVDLRLDSDKYLIIEESSKVKFELEGDTEKGAIRIHLEEGAVYNEINNPLGENDSYEIHTPDGVMAVRGTKFRVAIGYSEDHNFRETTITVLEGTVHVSVNNTVNEETSLTAGEAAIIEKDLRANTESQKEEPRLKKDDRESSPSPSPSPSSGSKPTETPNPTPTSSPSPTPKTTMTPSPAPAPTPESTPESTPEPSPSEEPSPSPSEVPSPSPSEVPSPSPSEVPSPSPSEVPSPSPSEVPSPSPSEVPSPSPSEEPIPSPSEEPSPSPSEEPSPSPSEVPSPAPSESP